MSIQDWGALGEIIGAAGVIITLLFLSMQIRAITKESRLSATADIAREYNAYLQHITSDEQLSGLCLRAVDRQKCWLFRISSLLATKKHTARTGIPGTR